tara:strand:+ start:185 stop:361 length:177 start_codon:yes stop_codon:yes gene_type:complete
MREDKKIKIHSFNIDKSEPLISFDNSREPRLGDSTFINEIKELLKKEEISFRFSRLMG